jgi:hypothetical protein
MKEGVFRGKREIRIAKGENERNNGEENRRQQPDGKKMFLIFSCFFLMNIKANNRWIEN